MYMYILRILNYIINFIVYAMFELVLLFYYKRGEHLRVIP